MAAVNFVWAGRLRAMVDPYVCDDEVGDQVSFARQGKDLGRNNDSDGGHRHSQRDSGASPLSDEGEISGSGQSEGHCDIF